MQLFRQNAREMTLRQSNQNRFIVEHQKSRYFRLENGFVIVDDHFRGNRVQRQQLQNRQQFGYLRVSLVSLPPILNSGPPKAPIISLLAVRRPKTRKICSLSEVKFTKRDKNGYDTIPFKKSSKNGVVVLHDHHHRSIDTASSSHRDRNRTDNGGVSSQV